MASSQWRLHSMAFIISLALLSQTCKNMPWIDDETGATQDVGIIKMRHILKALREPVASPLPPRLNPQSPWSKAQDGPN
ncbi:hypothetical protein AMTRI_Chr13g85040 [Amborella trichopoda]